MMIYKLFILLLFLTISNGHLATKRLYEDLLSDYNRLIRPVLNNNDTVYVNLSLKLTQLLDINMKQQVMSTNVWVELNWFDFGLQWNPKDYDGVDLIFIPAEDIWQPDIVLFNADGIYQVASMTKALIYHTGEVYWKPPALFKSTCEIDVEFFPFDVQCHMKFASWTYDGQEVDLRSVDKSFSVRPNASNPPETSRLVQESFKSNSTLFLNQTEHDNQSLNINQTNNISNESIKFNRQIQTEYKSVNTKASGLEKVEIGIDMSDFYTSVEWDVLAVPAIYKREYFSGIQNPYPDITFQIKLRRKTLFYTVNLIIPIVGNGFLTLFTFFLPSDSGEKVTLSISVLVSLTVFFLLLAEIIPPTSLAVPLLGKYLLFTMLLITLSICCTVGILNIHYRTLSTHIMKPWVRRFFIEILPKYLFMNRPTLKDLQRELRNLSKPNKFQFTSCSDLDTNSEPALRFLPSNSARNYGYQGIQSTNTSFDDDQLNKSAFVYNFNTSLDQTELPYDTDLGMPQLIFPQIQPKEFDSNMTNDIDDHFKHTISTTNSSPIQPKESISYGKDVEQAINSILTIAEHLKREDEERNVVEDWKFVAMTLDRLFLILFSIVCILGTCFILLKAPSLYDQAPGIESPNFRNLVTSSGSN